MKKLILFILLGLFACKKTDLKETVNEYPHEVTYIIEVTQYQDYLVSVFFREHGILKEIKHVENEDFEINITAKEGEILELGYLGTLEYIKFEIYVNGHERVNHGFGSNNTEYTNVIYEL